MDQIICVGLCEAASHEGGPGQGSVLDASQAGIPRSTHLQRRNKVARSGSPVMYLVLLPVLCEQGKQQSSMVGRRDDLRNAMLLAAQQTPKHPNASFRAGAAKRADTIGP